METWSHASSALAVIHVHLLRVVIGSLCCLRPVVIGQCNYKTSETHKDLKRVTRICGFDCCS